MGGARVVVYLDQLKLFACHKRDSDEWVICAEAIAPRGAIGFHRGGKGEVGRAIDCTEHE